MAVTGSIGRLKASAAPVAQAIALPLMVAAILGLTFWILMKRGGVGGAMAFARSRHKVYAPSASRVRFADVAGIDEAVSELTEVVEFLKTLTGTKQVVSLPVLPN